jgi:GNAT superfamily N-acetyltransferase
MMVPLDPAAARYVRAWLRPLEAPGLLALHHALVYHRPGLWGDVPGSPRSVILLREGHRGLEAFGAGRPEPAVGWLIGRRREFTLHAPEEWYDAIRERLGNLDLDSVETWTGPAIARPAPPAARRPGAGSASGGGAGAPAPATTRTATASGPITRQLTDADADAVIMTLPPWALRGWRSFSSLIEHGAGFGAPYAGGFATVAWIYDRAENYDAVGVFTVPRFRRLGLARASASALIRHIARERGRSPLWSTPTDNEPSRSLARSLGFSVAAEEFLLHWPPRNPPEP